MIATRRILFFRENYLQVLSHFHIQNGKQELCGPLLDPLSQIGLLIEVFVDLEKRFRDCMLHAEL